VTPQPMVLRRLRPVGTYVRGLRQPVVLAYIALDAAQLPDDLAARLQAVLQPHLPALAPPDSGQTLPDALGALVARLQEAGGLPVLERAHCMSKPGDSVAVLALPTLSAKACSKALQWLLLLANALAQAPGQTGLLAAQQASLQDLLAQLGQLAPAGQNNRHFIRAAHQLRIPCKALPGGVWQYGWGCRARLLRSTISDVTGAVGVAWTKDKIATSAVLRMAGLPVPAHQLARSAEEACKIAAQLGLPVVVKPAALDQGIGVEAGLQTLDEVQLAYTRAAKLSSATLVEKHINGRDYRLLVFQGRLVWANERIPAAVTGDGQSSVAELVALANLDPRRGPQKWLQMSPITLNEEAHELLAAAGLSPASVPAQGVFVRLRRAANVSSGGTPVACFEQVHPDNAQLAEHAARLLRLDLAGVDLLLPDIAVSWRESGGGICEVNSQPQLSLTSPHIHGQILRSLVQGDGRVPSCLVLATAADTLARQLTQQLQQQGLAAQLAPAVSALPGCWLDPDCGAVVLAGDAPSLLRSGMPADRFDVQVLDEATLHSDPPEALLSLLRPHVSVLVLRSQNPASQALCRQFFDDTNLHFVTTDAELLAIVAQLMRSSDKAHAAHGRNRTPS
jgi:cyanophycin synthetase